MIDINIIRNESERVKKAIANKKVNPELVDKFLEIDKKWRSLTSALDNLRAERKLFKEGDKEKAKPVKKRIKDSEEEIGVLEKERDLLLEKFPNIPSDDAPVGVDDSENVVVREVGEKTKFDFVPKDYLSVAGGLINTDIAAKVAGSRFGYILGDLAVMEFALVKLAFDRLLPHGFVPVVPPVMIKPEILKGMGKAKFIAGDDAFYLPKDDLYMVGSSEHTIGPLNMDTVFEPGNLPARYLGFSTCFRREAGSYGKDTKGILRVHQFDKVEMFSIALPEKSEEEHQFLLKQAEGLVQDLGLHYRIVSICTGDMGFENYKQYDIETWMPGQNQYRETCSASNTTDYQARGLNIKYKTQKNGKPGGEYVHMLNCTAIPIGRMLIAIIENYQNKEGNIMVPEALREYVGKKEIKPNGKNI